MQANVDLEFQIKRIELDLLRAFIDCCEKIGLKYFLLGGTMLGAVRHQGFIPWDDDIDVGMFREDYDIFLREGQNLLPSYYFIQSLYTEPDILFNMAKIRDCRTTFIESSVKSLNINHGIYIDVFPLDFYPVDSIKQVIFDQKRRLLGWRIRRELTLTNVNKGSRKEELLRKAMGSLLSIRYHKVHDAIIAREILYKSVPNSNLIANYNGAWGNKEIVPADWYGDGVDASFEGLSVRLPTKYDKWLTQVYGDYMQLPPEEKRVTHHYTEIIDTNKPYTAYI